MKIRVVTSEVTLECEDYPTFHEGFTRHSTPDIINASKQLIDKCVEATNLIIKEKKI